MNSSGFSPTSLAGSHVFVPSPVYHVPLMHDAVPLVGMRVRPAHHSRRKAVDREIEAGLRRVAFEDRGLHAELVVLGRRST